MQLAVLLTIESIDSLLGVTLPAECIINRGMAPRWLSLAGLAKELTIATISSKRVFSPERTTFPYPVISEVVTTECTAVDILWRTVCRMSQRLHSDGSVSACRGRRVAVIVSCRHWRSRLFSMSLLVH